jgi:hypothetical protein
MQGPTIGDHLLIGLGSQARAVVLRRAALAFRRTQAAPNALAEWETLLHLDRARGAQLVRILAAANEGDGVMINIAANVRTAADFAAELPVPAQGLPKYSDPSLLRLPVPQRPPPLLTAWLTRLPTQQLPPGFHPLPWMALIRWFDRRIIAHTLNQSMRNDAHCFRTGEPPANLRRPSCIALGKGAATLLPHSDGPGTWNASDILFERTPDGLYDALDFTAPGHTKWIPQVIANFIGATKDQEILSFLFEGVRWTLESRRATAAPSNAQPRKLCRPGSWRGSHIAKARRQAVL